MRDNQTSGSSWQPAIRPLTEQIRRLPQPEAMSSRQINQIGPTFKTATERLAQEIGVPTSAFTAAIQPGPSTKQPLLGKLPREAQALYDLATDPEVFGTQILQAAPGVKPEKVATAVQNIVPLVAQTIDEVVGDTGSGHPAH